MVGLRPVGIHRHFRVLNIYTRLQHRLGKSPEISLGEMKRHIDTLYNMPLLDEIEDDYEDDEDADENTDEGLSAKAESRTTFQDKHDESENTSGDGGEGGEGKESHLAQDERSTSLSGIIPPSSIGATLDATDPQFWRKKNVEFSLPWADFGALMIEKAGVGVEDRDDAESDVFTPKVESPDAEPEPEAAERESSDGRVSPVPRRRRGRSSTPVQRNRTKATRSTVTASNRKRQKTR
ncbi:hypothetical protein IWW54_005827 [Coemansia sp. RSA 2705]|nr:hypothetical protein IWW54_005827 [Coemansia sp. RSA 2705]